MLATAVRIRGRPSTSAMFRTARRIAARMEPPIARAFLDAVARVTKKIDQAILKDALAGGHVATVEAALASGGNLANALLAERELEKVLLRASTATGNAGAEILSTALRTDVAFNALHPDVVLFARTQAGELVADVSTQTRAVIRSVLSLGQSQGLTVESQARLLTTTIGLPTQWAQAPLALGDELRNGIVNTGRLLKKADLALIKNRIDANTVNEAFIRTMQDRYAANLKKARATTIARTESLSASHHGQHEGWKQAIANKDLPKTARRIVIVTDDERLAHWMVPDMNPDGRGMNEMFQSPEGPALNPPFRPNCRCGVGLIFPGHPGVL